MPMKPWYNEDREYENLINEIRVEQGYTLRELGSKLGMSSQALWRITQGYTGPYNRSTGKLKDWALKLQDIFGYELSEIFPREVCSIKTSNLLNCQLRRIAHGYQGEYYADLEFKFNHYALKELVWKGVETCLTKREQKVMHMRFNEDKTLDQISKVLHVNKERVRQIEATSLRILRGYVSRTEKGSSLYEKYYTRRIAEQRKRRERCVKQREQKIAKEKKEKEKLQKQKQLISIWDLVTV